MSRMHVHDALLLEKSAWELRQMPIGSLAFSGNFSRRSRGLRQTAFGCCLLVVTCMACNRVFDVDCAATMACNRVFDASTPIHICHLPAAHERVCDMSITWWHGIDGWK